MGQAPAPSTDPAATLGGRVARNTLFSAVGEGSNALLFVLGFLAARLLEPVAFGDYSAAYAYVGLFRLLPDLGMSYAATLAISRDRGQAGRLVGNLLGFQAVLSLVTLGLCLGLGAWLFDGVTWSAVVVLSIDLVLKAVKSTARWLLKSLEMFGAESISLAAERLAILVFGTLALTGGHGVVGFVLVFAAVRLVDTGVLVAWVASRVLPLRPAFELALWRELLVQGLPFAYAGAVILMFFQVDAVLLELMRGSHEVGLYSAPVRVLEGLTLVPRILGYALLPTMAALHAAGAREDVAHLYARGAKYLVVAGLPIAAFGLLESDRFIPFLFGPRYRESVPLAELLIPSATFMFLSNFAETTLACIARVRAIVITSTVALALNVALNVALIPRHGALGSAWATLATEASYLALSAACVRAYGYRAQWLLVVGRPVLATVVFAAVLSAAGSLPLLVSASAASVAFAAATVLLGVWDARERELLLRLVQRRRGSTASVIQTNGLAPEGARERNRSTDTSES